MPTPLGMKTRGSGDAAPAIGHAETRAAQTEAIKTARVNGNKYLKYAMYIIQCYDENDV